MNAVITTVKRFFRKLSFFFPTRLPIGMAEFDAWAKSIIDTYEFPDNDSLRWALATMILHVKSTEAYKPKRYFVLTTLKGMSSQVAGAVMQALKEKQQAQISAEATATSAAASNESKK